MTDTPEPEPSEREHREAIAWLRGLDRAATRDWQDVALGQRELQEVESDRIHAGDDPTAIERAKSLFRPYDELEQRRLLDAMVAEVAKSNSPRAVNDRNPRGRLALSLVVVAAAIAILFIVLDGRPSSTDRTLHVAELPEYRLETDGGLVATRTAAPPGSEPLRYVASSEFEWIVRPRRDVVGAQPTLGVAARAAAGGAFRRISPTLEVADSGAIRLTGTIAELGLGPGEWIIEVVLVRESGWHVDAVVVTLPLTIEPPG